MGTCCPDGYSPPDLLEVGLAMVFKPLADWKVQLLSIGTVEGIYEQLKDCLVVGWKNDWMTRPTQRHVLYQDWTSSTMTNYS